MRLFHKKDTKIICRGCGSHIATWSKDLYFNDIIEEEMVKQDAGQAPWRNCDRMACRECGDLWEWVITEATANAC